MIGNFGTVINRLIDLLPAELHLPKYKYSRPGTKLAQHLQRKDPGMNKHDATCKEYSCHMNFKYSDSINRAKADKEFTEKTLERVKSNVASLREKAVALAVNNIMKTKIKVKFVEV